MKTRHLGPVMTALAANPSPQIVDLCRTLSEDPVFIAESDRKSFALELLAAVKPMDEKTAAVFERSNQEGYFGYTARLFTENGSPRALALFESMMLDQVQSLREPCRVPPRLCFLPRRMDGASWPRRSDTFADLGARIAGAVIESVFDFASSGSASNPDLQPPPGRARPLRAARRLSPGGQSPEPARSHPGVAGHGHPRSRNHRTRLNRTPEMTRK